MSEKESIDKWDFPKKQIDVYKIIKYEFFGNVPLHTYQPSDRKTIHHNTVWYDKWYKFCEFQLNKQGRPNQPIAKLVCLKIIIYVETATNCDTRERTDSIIRFLVGSGIIKSNEMSTIPNLRIEGRYAHGEPRCEIILTVKDDFSKNLGIKWGNLPLID